MSTADLLGSYTAKDDMDEDAEGEEEEAAEGAVDLMGNNTGDEDSSEEEDDDSEAEREVRAGQSFAAIPVRAALVELGHAERKRGKRGEGGRARGPGASSRLARCSGLRVPDWRPMRG